MRPLTMQDFVAIWRRRRWLFIATSAILAASTCVVVGFLPSQYSSQALILIKQPDVSPQFVKSNSGVDSDQVLSGLIQEVMSRTMIERLPYFRKAGTVSEDDITDFQSNASIQILRDNSDPRRLSGKPYGLTVSVLSTTPKKAQELTNELAQLLVQQGDKAFLNVAQSTTSMLRSQLNMAAAKLQIKAQALDDFKKRYAGQLPVETQFIMETLANLEAQLDAETQAIERTRSNISDLQTNQTATAAGNDSKASNSPGPATGRLETDLQTLKDRLVELESRYKPTYPDVIRTKDQVKLLEAQVAAEKAKSAVATPSKPANSLSPKATASKDHIRELQLGLAARLKARDQIEQRIAYYQANLSKIPLHTQEYTNLQRDYDGARKDYESLRDKVAEAELSTAVFQQHEGVHLRLQDSASLPSSPELPVRWKINLGGLAGSLFLGLALAAFLEIRDTSMKSEEDVKFYTELPTLAVLPDVPTAAEVKRVRWKRAFLIADGLMLALVLAGLNYYVYVMRLGIL